MYRAFNLVDINWEVLSSESAAKDHQENTRLIRDSLDSFIENGIIDGTRLSTHWFPRIEADVFISHSHSDEGSAIKCASWLKDNFGLNAFVDSCIWEHAEELLRKIDNQFCLNPSRETYDYEKRNQSTSHVHMMLATALCEMLDTAECVFFLNTPNSITSEEAISKTKSPWLFYELASLRTIRRTDPRRIKILKEAAERQMGKAAAVKVEYIVSLEELSTLTAEQLNKWFEECTSSLMKGDETLDVLYGNHP